MREDKMLARPETAALDPALSAEMLRAVPALRRFAHSLCSNKSDADDLVQDALLRAISKINFFTPGTNMQAWLFVILRNLCLTMWRKRQREVGAVDDFVDDLRFSSGCEEDAISRLDWAKVEQLLPLLPPEQRDALVLVVVEGLAYEHAAEICGVAVGTVKSRVNRARERLAEMMDSYSLDWCARAGGSSESMEESVAWRRIVESGALGDGFEAAE